jgi:hypothetical protein
MNRLDWFILEWVCYPIFIDIIIMDIRRVIDIMAIKERKEG